MYSPSGPPVSRALPVMPLEVNECSAFGVGLAEESLVFLLVVLVILICSRFGFWLGARFGQTHTVDVFQPIHVVLNFLHIATNLRLTLLVRDVSHHPSTAFLFTPIPVRQLPASSLQISRDPVDCDLGILPG